jgi:hypothetical protein
MLNPYNLDGQLAYSLEELLDLCLDPENREVAQEHLNRGNFDRWLKDCGYQEFVIFARRNRYRSIERFCSDIKNELKRQMQIYLELDKSIEITLKEYDTLREEIILRLQARYQFVTLALAAIFTIAGFGIAPLTGLLTSEKTTITLQPNHEITVQEKSDKPKISISNFNTEKCPEDPENKTKCPEILTIIRETEPSTVKRAIIPSVIIFTWIIPMGALYTMYRSINIAVGTVAVGEYIAKIIEAKLHKYYQEKLKLLHVLGSHRQNNVIMRSRYSPYLYPLAWESNMSENQKSSWEVRGASLMFFFFSVIILFSLIGGSILINLDYKNSTLFSFSDQEKNIFVDKLGVYFLILILSLIFVFCISQFIEGENNDNTASKIGSIIIILIFLDLLLWICSQNNLDTIQEILLETIPIFLSFLGWSYLLFFDLLALKKLRQEINTKLGYTERDKQFRYIGRFLRKTFYKL